MNQSGQDIQDLIGFLGKRVLVLIAFALVGVAVSVILTLILSKTYRAEAVVALVTAEAQDLQTNSLFGQFGGLAGIAGVRLGKSDPLHAVAVLESKAFTESFIERHQLLPLLYPNKWDDRNEEWAVEESDRPSIRDARRMMEQTIRRIEQDPMSGLVWVIVDWQDPELAAEWANQMIKDANSELRNKALSESKKSIEYLEEELESTNIIELRQALFRLLEQQMHRVMLAKIRQEYALKIIDPAVPPELDDPIRPKPLVLVVIGFLLGLLIGTVVVLTSRRLRMGIEQVDVAA